MSSAQPKGSDWRRQSYLIYTPNGPFDRPTPKQRRRRVHKRHRELEDRCGTCADYDSPRKGRPTPKRADAISQRRARRHAKELFRTVRRG